MHHNGSSSSFILHSLLAKFVNPSADSADGEQHNGMYMYIYGCVGYICSNHQSRLGGLVFILS